MRNLSDIQKLVRNEPNDQALGEAVRKFFTKDDPKHYRICIGTCKFCGKKINTMNHEN
jgi:hypothetical protein